MPAGGIIICSIFGAIALSMWAFIVKPWHWPRCFPFNHLWRELSASSFFYSEGAGGYNALACDERCEKCGIKRTRIEHP